MSNVLYRTETGSGTTLASVIFRGIKGKRNTVVVSYNATSDLSTAVLTFLNPSWETKVDATSAAAQKVLNVTSTTGRAQDDVIVVQRADGSVERMEVDTVQAGVSLTMKANIAVACAANDKVYVMTSTGTIAVGAATVANIAAGDYGFIGVDGAKPLLVDTTGTAACSINTLTVVTE
jgi:hypothetical protein